MKTSSRKEVNRTCCVCRRTADKREFLRIVRAGDMVEFDKENKKNGRGTYVCKNKKCIEGISETNALSHALRCSVNSDNIKVLVEDLLGVIAED